MASAWEGKVGRSTCKCRRAGVCSDNEATGESAGRLSGRFDSLAVDGSHLGSTRRYPGSATADLVASLGAEPGPATAALWASAVPACTIGARACACSHACACACASGSHACALGSGSCSVSSACSGSHACSYSPAGDLVAWACAHAARARCASPFISPRPGSNSGTG